MSHFESLTSEVSEASSSKRARAALRMLRVVALIAAASAWPKNCNRPWELKSNDACAREINSMEENEQ